MVEIGHKYTSKTQVTLHLAADNMGSGDMPVFATPAMLALMENAAMMAVKPYLTEGCTTVGGYIEASHLRPTKLGDNVTATAVVTKVEGKKIEFHVEAHCGDVLLGEGNHLRVIVDRDKFIERLK